jgi:hypothetical protein
MQAGDSADVPKGNQELIKQGAAALPESEFPSNALTSDLRNPVMKVNEIVMFSPWPILRFAYGSDKQDDLQCFIRHSY